MFNAYLDLACREQGPGHRIVMHVHDGDRGIIIESINATVDEIWQFMALASS